MKKITATLVSIILAIGLVAVTPANPAAANSVPVRFMSGWMPYWTTNASVSSFLANSAIFSDISPFWHNAVRNGAKSSKIAIQDNLSKNERVAVLSKIKGKGAYILPSITDGTPAGYMAGVMKNPTRRAALVSQILKLVIDNNYDGIDLDFERFAFSDGQSSWAKTRPAWVQFMKQLSQAFKPKGKLIAVAVPPMEGDRNGYWVYDFKGIAPYINKLRVMAYDYSWDSPGPVGGPLSWVESLSRYAVAAVGGRKFQLGTPTYGRDWVTKKSGSGCPSTYTKVFNSDERISIYGSSGWRRDAASAEVYKDYTQSYNGGRCKIRRSAWVSDQYTAVKRLEIAKKYNAGGLAQWMVGTEVPAQWAMLRRVAGIKSQGISRKYTNIKRRPGSRLIVRGKLSPARSTTLKLQRHTSKGWRTVGKVRTTKAGNYRTSVRSYRRKARYIFRLYAPASARYTRGYSKTIVLRTR